MGSSGLWFFVPASDPHSAEAAHGDFENLVSFGVAVGAACEREFWRNLPEFSLGVFPELREVVFASRRAGDALREEGEHH